MELSSPTLAVFQHRDKNILSFPINFKDLSLLGFQAYGNIFIRVSARPNRFYKGRLTMHCCCNSDGAIPWRISRLATTTSKNVRRTWLRNLKSVLIGLCFLVLSVLFNIHLVHGARLILSSSLKAQAIVDELAGEICFRRFWEITCGGIILDPTHPTHIRVESIFKEIINACNVGFKLEDDKVMTIHDQRPKTSNHIVRCNNERDQIMTIRDEVFKRLSCKYSPHHLAGRKWQLAVVETAYPQAGYFRGIEMICVTTGFLEYYCNSHADIAAILGHEVGHGIMSPPINELFRLLDCLSTFVRFKRRDAIIVPFYLLFHKWFGRRDELMADYIGLMLMASAGYDPRAFPTLMERMSIDDDDDYEFQPSRKGYVMCNIRKLISDLLSSHPSRKTRVDCLQQVMDEAVTLYYQIRGAVDIS